MNEHFIKQNISNSYYFYIVVSDLITLLKTSSLQNAVTASQIIIFLNCITVVMQQIHAFVREGGGIMNMIYFFKEYFYLDEYEKRNFESFIFKI